MAINKKTIGGLALVTICAGTAFAINASADSQTNASSFDKNSCGEAHLIDITTRHDTASAEYHYVSCETDQFGKLTMTDGTFKVYPSSADEPHVIAALGQTEAERIENILSQLSEHMEHVPSGDSIYVHGMPCNSSIKLAGIENGEVVVESRQQFGSALPRAFGCNIEKRAITEDSNILNDEAFKVEEVAKIRAVQNSLNSSSPSF